MRFAISTAFLPVPELPAIARAADELGYDALAIPDHVVDLETLRTPYPYTPDGARRWGHDAAWPDPWVLAGSLAAVTERLRFFTSVYVPALRNPFQVAKSVGTAAVLSGNRVALGVGIGWCEEEFELLEQEFGTRGRRTDEGLALLKRLWEPGWTEFAGEHYSAPRLVMEPTPTAPVPVYVGGLSEAALRRAARHDGWVGDMYRTDEALRWAARLQEVRAEAGATGDFRVIVALTDAVTPEQFARAEAGGVTDCMTMPWAYYTGLEATLEQKLDGMARFAEDVLRPMAG
ncbi:TIGR03619 family F420-dependent LLM class oxidoreductase [Nocardioides sp. zg-579]|uniref:TIGR03619 family F420-dependent LLM class oxidoreductase n=1 Tax=Nocardioides marmotae TaxID=2663857 RepID=A0A6I3JA50_9ACTN|nr:TIGR03619 family F420-dependent LLM class oxidoreductase [Nocardioides marmotae]MCR6031260.1 TIGR03619 family F420-dependent LLM class oxidoreductase [Gordonia jinghuaiqii]MTB94898.1 TIGR03619 family F420-dependent LLM class oxidoreductase [Nocardioides marmotae]QKE02587.1 TIGR03619 family F420-dependent LLM class oxidoreductase [Nocardioides marmotae]